MLLFAHLILVEDFVKLPTNTFFSKIRSFEQTLSKCQDWNLNFYRSLLTIIAILLALVEVKKDIIDIECRCFLLKVSYKALII